MAAACTKSGRQSGHWTRVQSTSPAPVDIHSNSANPAPSVVTNGIANPAADRPTTMTTPSGPQTPSEGQWLRLGEWAAANLGIAPKRVINGAAAFSLETESGILVLTSETRLATFQGVSLWLGFAPFWSEGDCFVHEVDLRRNVLPLLRASAASPPTPGTVVIDPGHGGNNLGTRSVLPDLFEKQLTLDWALRLEPLLREQGWNVVLTRRDDRDLSLTERVEVADQSGAHLFLSLHFNSALPQTEQAGLETFATTPVGLPSTLTRGYEDDVTRVFPNNAHDDDNIKYAMRLHRALLQVGGMTDRGVRRARFMGVLRSQRRPAVLLEAGYLSNPEEARRAATPEYRQQLAEAVAKALAPNPILASSSREHVSPSHPPRSSE